MRAIGPRGSGGLRALINEIAAIPEVELYGRVQSVQGLLVEIAGPVHAMSIGSRVTISGRAGVPVAFGVLTILVVLILPLPPFLLHPPVRMVDAWDYDGVAAIPGDADVCILGTGLSMVDAALTLGGDGRGGRILALSRHGLLPLAHANANPALHRPARGYRPRGSS